MPTPIPPAQPAPNVTFTSSEPAATAVRTGIQGLTGAFIVDFIEAFELYDFTERQYGLAVALAGMVLAFIQNLLEKRRGRKFLGAAPTPATRDDDGQAHWQTVVVMVAIVIVLLILIRWL